MKLFEEYFSIINEQENTSAKYLIHNAIEIALDRYEDAEKVCRKMTRDKARSCLLKVEIAQSLLTINLLKTNLNKCNNIICKFKIQKAIKRELKSIQKAKSGKHYMNFYEHG